MSRRPSEISVIRAGDQPFHTGTLFVQGVPLTTKAEFKSACAKASTSMRDALIKLMRFYVMTQNKKLKKYGDDSGNLG